MFSESVQRVYNLDTNADIEMIPSQKHAYNSITIYCTQILLYKANIHITVFLTCNKNLAYCKPLYK